MKPSLKRLQHQDKPVLIDFKTVIGFGSPKADTSAVHGSPLKPEELDQTRKALNWSAAAFDVPADILTAWRTAGARGTRVATSVGRTGAVGWKRG